MLQPLGPRAPSPLPLPLILPPFHSLPYPRSQHQPPRPRRPSPLAFPRQTLPPPLRPPQCMLLFRSLIPLAPFSRQIPLPYRFPHRNVLPHRFASLGRCLLQTSQPSNFVGPLRLLRCCSPAHLSAARRCLSQALLTRPRRSACSLRCCARTPSTLHTPFVTYVRAPIWTMLICSSISASAS